MRTVDRTLFPELNTVKEKSGQRRDPFGCYDTRKRHEAYERKIDRLRATIKYLASVTGANADAIRKRDIEIERLKNIINNRDK